MSNASYVTLAASGELAGRADELSRMLADCRVCPHECRADRSAGDLGTCATGADAVVASWGPHHGEEPVISARGGSGTVFLASCNLACVFCQNHDISARRRTAAHRVLRERELASVFLELQDGGCHNLNWVSPSHQVPQLVRALALAAERGLTIPVVYNTNAYDSVAVLRLLEGIVDIWMPDLKYASAEVGEALSGAPDYPARARQALAEMYRQVGDMWEVDEDGALHRGMLVRILVLPGGLAGVEDSLRFLADELSPRVAVSLLAQYHPAHRVSCLDSHQELQRGVSGREWRDAALALARHMEGDRHHLQGVFLRR